MRIIRPGQLTTVQDLGRRGYRAAGVPLSGAVIGAYGEARYEFMDGEGDQLVFRLGVRF
jgi:hypothetical protein